MVETELVRGDGFSVDADAIYRSACGRMASGCSLKPAWVDHVVLVSAECQGGKGSNPERDGNCPERDVYPGRGDPVISAGKQVTDTDDGGQQQEESQRRQGRYAERPAVQADLIGAARAGDKEVNGTTTAARPMMASKILTRPL